jgi:hypothetical protein
MISANVNLLIWVLFAFKILALYTYIVIPAEKATIPQTQNNTSACTVYLFVIDVLHLWFPWKNSSVNIHMFMPCDWTYSSNAVAGTVERRQRLMPCSVLSLSLLLWPGQDSVVVTCSDVWGASVTCLFPCSCHSASLHYSLRSSAW